MKIAISYSQFSSFSECKAKWWYEWVERRRSITFDNYAYLIGGRVAHKITQDFFLNSISPERRLIENLVNDEMRSWKYALDKLAKADENLYGYDENVFDAFKRIIVAKIINMLTVLLTLPASVPLSIDTLSAEERIVVPIKANKRSAKNRFFKAFFDMVSHGDPPVIFELKFNKAWKDDDMTFLMFSDQVLSYAWAYWKRYGVVPTIYYIVSHQPRYRQKKNETQAELFNRIADEIEDYPDKYVSVVGINFSNVRYTASYTSSASNIPILNVITRNIDEIEKFEKRLSIVSRQIVESIKKGDYFPEPPKYQGESWKCKNCIYRPVCFDGVDPETYFSRQEFQLKIETEEL